MKYCFKNILLIIFYINFSYPNTLDYFKSNEVMLRFKNELVKDMDEDVYQSNRKKMVMIGLSGLFPGLGHFYSGNKKVGGIYSMIEIAGWMGRDRYLSRAEISAREYKEYARAHWSLAKWIRDYFDPIGINDNGQYNPMIDAAFDNQDDIDEIIDYFDGIPRAWSHAHSIRFEYQGDMKFTGGGDEGEFATEIYPVLCGIDPIPAENYPEGSSLIPELVCNATLEEIEGQIDGVEYDHHLFEGVSKYNMYFAGWDDSHLGYMQMVGQTPVVYSANKKIYENGYRAKHKRNNNTADDFVAMLLINRAVSMLDIILRKTNNVSINTSSNYDIDNKYRINGINLSIWMN